MRNEYFQKLRARILTKILFFLFTCRLQPLPDDCAVQVQWFSSVAKDPILAAASCTHLHFCIQVGTPCISSFFYENKAWCHNCLWFSSNIKLIKITWDKLENVVCCKFNRWYSRIEAWSFSGAMPILTKSIIICFQFFTHWPAIDFQYSIYYAFSFAWHFFPWNHSIHE